MDITKTSDPFIELSRLFELCDQAVADVKQNYPKEMVCRKGCADCCHAFFDVSLIEAININRAFNKLDRKQKREIIRNAEKFNEQWQKLNNMGTDVSKMRIKCPLLSKKHRECQLYQVRPVNCRTYGIPTLFDGSTHVCGLSGFKKGQKYPTLNMEPIQQKLLELSQQISPGPMGQVRWPISIAVIDPGGLFARLGH